MSTTVTFPGVLVQVALTPWGAVLSAAMVPALLVQALNELRIVRRELRELVDASRRHHAVDYAIEAEDGQLVGVREKGDTTELVTIGDPAKVQGTIDRVRQAYSRLKVINEVKKQGYRIAKEERLKDGSFRVVVQRWQ